jgi:hypothetical protein
MILTIGTNIAILLKPGCSPLESQISRLTQAAPCRRVDRASYLGTGARGTFVNTLSGSCILLSIPLLQIREAQLAARVVDIHKADVLCHRCTQCTALQVEPGRKVKSSAALSLLCTAGAAS